MKQNEKRELASRFSCEDWQRLCGNGKFLFAMRQKSIEECEIMAEKLLAEWAGQNK
jgi:hypothetical protein